MPTLLYLVWLLVISYTNMSHGNEVLQSATRNYLYKDHATNEEVCAKVWQTIGPNHLNTPDHSKETQTEVVWTCFPFTRSGQNHLARHSEREKKTRQTEKEVGRQH